MNLFDLAAAVVGGLTVTVVSSLAFADRILKRNEREDQADQLDPDAARAAIAEKRRVIERDRKEWQKGLGSSIGATASKRMDECDEKLLRLADEEARLPRRAETQGAVRTVETKQEKDKRALDADLKALRDYIDEISPNGYGQAKRTRLLHALERIAERIR